MVGEGFDDDRDRGIFWREFFEDGLPSEIIVVSGPGGVEHGPSVKVNGGDGAFKFGLELSVFDEGAVELPRGGFHGIAGEAVEDEGFGPGGDGCFVFGCPGDGELDLGERIGSDVFFLVGIDGWFIEEGAGAGFVSREEHDDIEVEGADIGGEEAFVCFAIFVDEEVFEEVFAGVDAAGEFDAAGFFIEGDLVELELVFGELFYGWGCGVRGGFILGSGAEGEGEGEGKEENGAGEGGLHGNGLDRGAGICGNEWSDNQ